MNFHTILNQHGNSSHYFPFKQRKTSITKRQLDSPQPLYAWKLHIKSSCKNKCEVCTFHCLRLKWLTKSPFGKTQIFFTQYLERYTEHSARRTKASLTVCDASSRRAKGCQCQHSASVVGWRGEGAARACGEGGGKHSKRRFTFSYNCAAP